MKFWSVILIILLCACGKESLCPNNIGEIQREVRDLEDFNKILIEGDVELIFGKDSLQSVVLECGENLMHAISTEVQNETLLIDNKLKCNWIRDLNTPIRLFVNAPEITEIVQRGQRNIKTNGDFEGGFFQLICEGSVSKIDLSLKTDDSEIIQSASHCFITVKGESNKFFTYNNGTGTIDASEMLSNNSIAINKSIGPIEINANERLKGEIHNRGDVIYFGEPDSINFSIIHPGTGSFIPQ